MLWAARGIFSGHNKACVADISKISSLYYKNSLFHWRSKNVLQMSSPALQAHLDPAGKVLDDPPAFLSWGRSYCCCDCCLQVRDSLGVVAIHPVLKVSPHIKIQGFKSGECGDHSGSHLWLKTRHCQDSLAQRQSCRKTTGTWSLASSCRQA